MQNRFRPRFWLLPVVPLSVPPLAALLLLLGRTMFTGCKWTSTRQRRMNSSSALVL